MSLDANSSCVPAEPHSRATGHTNVLGWVIYFGVVVRGVNTKVFKGSFLISGKI